MTQYAHPAWFKLADHGIDYDGKTVRHLTRSDYGERSLLVGINRAELRNMYRVYNSDVGNNMDYPFLSLCFSADLS